MSDAQAAGSAPGGGSAGGGFGSLMGRILAGRGDVGLAVGIVIILAVLLLPLPPWLLDLMLAISITFSVMILMVALFIQGPLEFSAFPTVLLIATMLRLALNLASTRLILSRGHEGEAAAGEVIRAFGHFIMQGNVVIGIIVFSILVLVNFIVITKGSGRIAEVAARFTLDAMPGKQMAIDADLSAGLIDESQAKARRQKLEDESAFFGAMDGASKFVRGDAVAGLIITVINIVGGIIVGTAQQGLTMGEAASTFTLLTVGDGLVSQVPALMVSVAAGLLVSKAGVDGAADKILFKQFTHYPQVMGMSAGVLVIMALLPGTPMLPFLSLAGGCAFLGFTLNKQKKTAATKAAEAEAAQVAEKAPKEEPISQTLSMDHLRLELGYGLLPLINDSKGYRLTDQIKALRRQLASDMGFVMPSVRILDNMQLGSDAYMIRVKEMEAGSGTLKLESLLVMDPRGAPIDLPGEDTKEPAFGLPAKWVDKSHREEASFRGMTVVDPATVVTTHLTEVLKENMSELLSYAETKKLLDELPDANKKLVEDLVPSQVSVSFIQRVLQTLLKEQVSIRDLPTILEAMAEAVNHSQSIVMVSEHVRMRLARQLCMAYRNADGQLPLIALSPGWEQAFSESLVGQGEEKQLAMAPSKLQEFIGAVRQQYDAAGQAGEVPVLLTSPAIRPYVRSIIERFRPQTAVMSQNEVHPRARLKTVGQI